MWVRYSTNHLTKNNKITEKSGKVCPVSLEDLVLFKNITPGTMINKDCLCDSTFMFGVIRDIGQAIRKSFQ